MKIDGKEHFIRRHAMLYKESSIHRRVTEYLPSTTINLYKWTTFISVSLLLSKRSQPARIGRRSICRQRGARIPTRGSPRRQLEQDKPTKALAPLSEACRADDGLYRRRERLRQETAAHAMTYEEASGKKTDTIILFTQSYVATNRLAILSWFDLSI